VNGLLVLLVAAMVLPGCADRAPAPAGPGRVTIEELLDDPAGSDGERIRVEAYLLVSPGSSVLTDRLLESYPPQAGSPSVWVDAPPPAGCLDEGTGVAAGTSWGTVSATGTFRYEADGGLGHLGEWTMALGDASLSCP
jgi:hypothetical protein